MKHCLAVIAVGIIASVIVSSFPGCATARGTRQLEAVPQGAPSTESNWSQVQGLAPAAEIMVTAEGSQPRIRYFLAADEFTLTTLNVTDPALPTAAARALRDMASRHPEYFLALNRGTVANGDIRIGPQGVVETVGRNDVVEIRGRVVARGSVLGTIVGGWLGFAVGVVPALGGASEAIASLLLVSSVAGGGFLGFHWSSHGTDGVIYRAP